MAKRTFGVTKHRTAVIHPPNQGVEETADDKAEDEKKEEVEKLHGVKKDVCFEFLISNFQFPKKYLMTKCQKFRKLGIGHFIGYWKLDIRNFQSSS